jgi:hypothetical protein
LLLINNKPSEKHDTRSQKCVSKFKKSVLVVAKEVVTTKSKKDIDKKNQGHGFLECTGDEVVYCFDNWKKFGSKHGSVFQQWDGTNDNNGGIDEHAYLVEIIQVGWIEVLVVGGHVYKVSVCICVIYVLYYLSEIYHENHQEVYFLKYWTTHN